MEYLNEPSSYCNNNVASERRNRRWRRNRPVPCAGAPLLLVVPVSFIATLISPPFFCATALVQIRTSRLTAWAPPNKRSTPIQQETPPPVIGWAREERNDEQQVYRVTVGLGEYDDESQNKDKARDNPASPSSSETTTTVTLPFMTDQDPLGSTLWSSGLASSILVQSASCIQKEGTEAPFSGCFSDIQDKSILELGAGLGLPGRVLASSSQGQGVSGKVVLTDNDEAVVAASKTLDVPASSSTDSQDSLGGETTTTAATTTIESRQLEWRDCPPSPSGPEDNNNNKALDQEVFDILLGADVAYYFFLLRPLMDTIQYYMSPAPPAATCLIVGQANRESQWDLYHNIQDGCYNSRTDQRDAPWAGETSMLLYNLHSTDWWTAAQDESESDTKTTTTTTPIAAILHQNARGSDDDEPTQLTPWDYIATKQDEDALDKSF